MEIMITHHDGIIEENFEDAKAYLAEQLEAYKTVVFTEDTKKDAKDTIAQLRKDKKALADRVKAVKVEYMMPFEQFLSKANELMALYDEPINYIDSQVAEFEKKRKEEKIAQVKEYYTEIIPEEEWQAVLPFNKIFNPKWENTTTTAKAIKEEIMRYKENAKTAYNAIKAMHSDKENEALDMYKRTLNLDDSMAFLNRYEEQKKEVLERERQREAAETEQRIRAEERDKIAQQQQHEQEMAEAMAQAAAESEQTAIDQFIPQDTEEEAKEYTYLLRLTTDAKKKVEMFMDSIGVDYFEC